MQQKQFQADLEGWREYNEQYDRTRDDLLAYQQANQAEARLPLVERLLPVLDGLDKALASGQKLLENAPSPDQVQAIGRLAATQSARWPLLVTLVAWPVILLARIFPALIRQAGWQHYRQDVDSLAADIAAWQDSHLAWLHGLELVRERLLETLALEDVYPIPTSGYLFDPHRHRVVDTVPARKDTPPGTIVDEWRRGYITGDRILRYAEVVVTNSKDW